MIRRRDPETFLYLMLLKKMKQNPSANVTTETKHEMVSGQPGEVGELKSLIYTKAEKYDKNKEIFKAKGVIQEESF